MIYCMSNGKEFSFCQCYIYSNDFLSPIYMRDQDGNIILNTSICNNEYIVLIYKQILKDIDEFVIITSQCIRILLIY